MAFALAEAGARVVVADLDARAGREVADLVTADPAVESAAAGRRNSKHP